MKTGSSPWALFPERKGLARVAENGGVCSEGTSVCVGGVEFWSGADGMGQNAEQAVHRSVGTHGWMRAEPRNASAAYTTQADDLGVH